LTEILAVDEMLAKLQGFDPLRRVLLATPGTLQGTLAAYFGELVDVQMLNQSQDGTTFDREVNLVLRQRGTVVCHAVSQITVEDEDFLKMIKEKQIGIGRIAQVLHRETSFLLETASQHTDAFMRTYRLEGEGFAYHIHEEFPAVLYPEQQRNPEVSS
jgi:hypothetical protein